MNTETAILTAMLSFGIASSLAILIDGLGKRLKERRRRISAARLNDCKPGCFMQRGKWEDTV